MHSSRTTDRRPDAWRSSISALWIAVAWWLQHSERPSRGYDACCTGPARPPRSRGGAADRDVGGPRMRQGVRTDTAVDPPQGSRPRGCSPCAPSSRRRAGSRAPADELRRCSNHPRRDGRSGTRGGTRGPAAGNRKSRRNWLPGDRFRPLGVPRRRICEGICAQADGSETGKQRGPVHQCSDPRCAVFRQWRPAGCESPPPASRHRGVRGPRSCASGSRVLGPACCCRGQPGG